MKSLLLALLLTGSAVAEENPLSVELLSEVKAIAPGETFTVGLHLKPPAGFHTYWKHPGIVGVATSVEWSLPPGFSAGESQWPAPQTVKMARYTAQGYRGESLLLVPITAPKTVPDPLVTLTAHVSWMCCGPQCHPASKVPFSITLPVAPSSTATATADPTTKPLFDRFREQVPKKDDAWRVEIARQFDSLLLTLTSNQPQLTRDVAELGTLRFFTADGQIDSDREQKVTRGPGQKLRIELPLSKQSHEGSKLAGVVVAQQSWRKDGTSVALELP
ncbi:protein-disulfide reductase DsbD family protein [Luteolibacter arcticus]|uniref:Protein-disulfide reductase DsbD family protein n=1 Tax=Luteolibacter arcticus TaxID=1581411 RepID=A0ABT3GSL9_9BACT|nr:protein-disulfide reductase DsbD domain-containing protein [Luteolibacter arcticus]MCW1926521.1 protein-disulfide reductase DsbD family protein [Luteolibacter arcticus]